ncbi:MAG: OmpA family protein [Myxococcota bacterium]
MLLTLLAMLASAQANDAGKPDLSSQVFRPSLDGDRMLWANESMMRANGSTTARAALHYAWKPFVLRDDEGNADKIVSDLFQGSFMLGHTRGPVRLGVDVPVYIRAMGSGGNATGLGDIAPDLKIRLRDGSQGGVGVGLVGRVPLPTSTVDPPVGNRNFGYEIEGIVDGEVGKTLLVANLGLRGIPTVDVAGDRWDDAIAVRLGASHALSDKTGLSLEGQGLVGVTGPTGVTTPIELMAAGYTRLPKNLVLRLGLGAGLTRAVGAPGMRALMGIGYEPGASAKPASDMDGDGIIDRKDPCPEKAEDMDGYMDDDGCPDPTKVTIKLQNAAGEPIDSSVIVAGKSVASGGVIELPTGPAEIKGKIDTYKPISVTRSIPGGESHEVILTLEPAFVSGTVMVEAVDTDGNPVQGATFTMAGETDAKGDAGQNVDVPIGDYQLTAVAPGYRQATKPVTVVEGETVSIKLDLEKAKVVIDGTKIDLRDSVYFNLGKDSIKPVSYGLLDEVAETLVAHPELTKIRVEGHTDSRGSASSNLALSKRRAASVMAYLVGKGVSADRLESEGFGETKPVKQGNNEAAWSANRRVDFFVVGRSDE